MAHTQLYAGDLVTPAVRLVRLLAEGGMGKVWIAHHLGLDARVVVKTMSEEMAARPDGRERFAREAAAAAAIKSPHVVQVFDHGVAPSGIPYIVMELLEGKDLGARLAEAEGGRLDPYEVVTIVVQVGKALSRAHRAGIVHRDVKPENIFLCVTDEAREAREAKEIHVKLLDFGTAKREIGSTTLGSGVDARARQTTTPGLIMGTPFYMSPEQSIGSEVDGRTDIWSLGVVAFEALTGVRPFSGSSVGAITVAIHGPVPRMTDAAPELPPALDDWFARACAHAPEDRFPTVRAAIDGFIEAVTGDRPGDQATESLWMPSSREASPSPPLARNGVYPSVAPVSTPIRPPLAASLPDPKKERRGTTLAAGAVAAAAALAMIAIVMSASSSRSSSPAAEAPPPAATAPEPAQAHADAPPPMRAQDPPPPPPPAAVPEEPEPSLPASPASAAHASASRHAPPKAHPPAKPAPATGSAAKAAPAAAPPAPANDDDLVRLQNVVTKQADPPPADAPAPAPAPSPEPASSPTQAPAPPPLPPPSADSP